jgi:hypothetical protein
MHRIELFQIFGGEGLETVMYPAMQILGPEGLGWELFCRDVDRIDSDVRQSIRYFGGPQPINKNYQILGRGEPASLVVYLVGLLPCAGSKIR